MVYVPLDTDEVFERLDRAWKKLEQLFPGFDISLALALLTGWEAVWLEKGAKEKEKIILGIEEILTFLPKRVDIFEARIN